MNVIVKSVGVHGLTLLPKELLAIGIKQGQRAKIEKWVPAISNDQRAMLFAYYQFCIDHGLKELGHYSVDGVHEDVKAWCNEVHPGDFGGNISITRMNKLVFDLFWKTVDLEYFQLLGGIDTSEFWKEYQDWKDSGTEMKFRKWKEGVITLWRY